MKNRYLFMIFAILVCVSVLVLSSCEPKGDTLCYYAYFESDAFLLVYNGERNTLYYVKMPTEVINRYAREEGFDLFTESFKDFAGIEETGTMLSSRACFTAIKEMLDAFSDGEASSAMHEVNAIPGNAGSNITQSGEKGSNADSNPINEKKALAGLEVLSARAGDFLEEDAASKISILCGTDLSPLFRALKGKNAKTAVLNAESVISSDLGFSRDYFRKWVSQIL